MARSDILRPLQAPKRKPRNIVTFDLESKKPDSQKRGFERPFLVGIYDSREDHYSGYFDDRNLDQSDRERAFRPGGCIDKFFRWLTETPAGRKLHSASRPDHVGSILYAHNGGAFDTLHLLRWLRLPENARRFRVRIVASGSQLLELRIIPISARRTHMKKGRRVKGPPQAKGWTIRDSMRLAPGSLEEIGHKLELDVRKTRMPSELGGLDAHEKHHEAWRAYNRTDCEAAAGAVLTLQKILHDLGGQLCMTLPASTMDLFRRRFLREFLNKRHLDGCPGGDRCRDRAYGGCNFMFERPGLPRERHFPGCRAICKICRQADVCLRGCPREKARKRACPAAPYGCLHAWLTISPTGARHGGRTEVFHHRETEGRLKYYDRNSSYAAAMLEPMPLKLAAITHAIEPGDVHYDACGGDLYEHCAQQAAKGWVGFVECTVFIPATCNIPPLPIVFGDKLVFPCGRFHGRWDWTELRHIRGVGGHIEAIHRSAWYDAAPVLASMMRTLYRLRLRAQKKGDKALGAVCKDLMNALYGKFIMSPDRKEIVSATEADAPEHGKPLTSDLPTNAPLGTPMLWGIPKHSEAPYFLPHIGAHITALGREALWLFMRDVETRGGRVYYCDTDAVCMVGPEMPSSDELGQWKRVHKRVKRLAGTFDSAKSYALTSLSGEPLDDVHDDACVARRRDGDKTAFDCRGCATSGVHIKGLHRSFHTVENFDALMDGETIEVTDQTPKLRSLIACDFREYETHIIPRASHTKRPANEGDKSTFVDKRVRVGDATRPLCMFDNAPWVYVDDGKILRSTLGEHFAWLVERVKAERRLHEREQRARNAHATRDRTSDAVNRPTPPKATTSKGGKTPVSRL